MLIKTVKCILCLSLSLSVFLPIALAQETITPLTPSLKVVRLNNNKPIITKQMFLDIDPALDYDGKNINGPSMVRIPDWVKKADRTHPTAVYYLYFAHHGHAYIRMAWSAKIEGPYTLYNTHPVDKDKDDQPGRGVLDLGTQMGKSGKPELRFSKDIVIKNNVASPDVIIDSANKRFIMFFHGHAAKPNYDSSVCNTGKQKSYVATSATGLNFNMPDGTKVSGGTLGGETGHGIKIAQLGNAYFRTFQYKNTMYAFSNYGTMWKAPSASEPWSTAHLKDLKDDAWTEQENKTQNPVYAAIKAFKPKGSKLSREEKKKAKKSKKSKNADKSENGNFNRLSTSTPRHFATLLQEDGHTLEVWYTARGDSPERIFRTTMDLSKGDWQSWITAICSKSDIHQEMLRPEFPWEGSELPVKGSSNGQTTFTHAMRDPALFRDKDGQVYLFYVGGGESAIGVAKVIKTK